MTAVLPRERRPGGLARPDAAVTDDVPATLTGVRAERNAGFDRVVFDCLGALPEAQVAYAPPGGTGPGRALLRVVLEPATHGAHAPDPPVIEGFPALRQVDPVWDTSRTVTWGITVAERSAFRVSRLPSPDRVVVDVDHVEPGIGGDVLQEGDVGAGVATWQWRLHLALSRAMSVDGQFGPGTRAATEDFQGAQGLSPHGRVDPRTRAAMARVLDFPEEDVLALADIRAAAAFLHDVMDGDDDLVGPLGELFTALGIVVRTLDTEFDEAAADRVALRPFVLTEQLRLLAHGLRSGTLVDGASFVQALTEAGASARPDAVRQFTWYDLTEVMGPVVDVAEMGRRDLLPALVLCLGRERAARRGDAVPDPVWGDEYLDPLQLILLQYAISYAPEVPGA